MGTKDLSTKELQAELERQGRVPAPPPRRQFVEELLTRIQVSADDELEIIDPEPVVLADRRAVARLRVLGALAVAAALLVAVGLYSQLRGSSGGSRVIMATASGDREVQVRPDGTIDQPDGTLDATCREQTSFVVNGERFECDKDDLIELTVQAGRVTDVEPRLAPIPTAEVESALPPDTTLAPAPSGGTGQPRSTTPDQGATTASPATSAPSSSAAPSGGGQAPGGVTTIVPSGSVPAASTPPPPIPFDLTAAPAQGSVTINWPAWSADSGQSTRYVVLRTVSVKDSGRDPETPTQEMIGGPAQAASTDQTSYVQPLDGTNGVPPDTPAVAYRVAVVDANNKVVGLSQTILVRLKWRSFGMQGDVDPPPTTTTTAPPAQDSDKSANS